MAFEQELKVALEAAHQAGVFLVSAYESFESIADAPANITTAADHQAQEIVLARLQRSFADDAYCAEEDSPALSKASRAGVRLWIIDPIDGTRGFARKNGEFSVMIGFVENGKIGVGVVHEPALQRLTYATRGGGCWRRDGSETAPAPCRVTTTTDLAAATLTQSRSREPDKPSPPVLALAPQTVRETYSAGIKLALVARGEVDLYVNTYQAFRDWDICAGHLLVTEAGGEVTGLRGEKLQYGLEGAWQKAGLLASNGRLHSAALKKLVSISF